MMQRQRDAAAGLNTGCFISGYRGSPLGGLDQALWSARRFGESNHIAFQPAINEELGATAIWGSQQLKLFPGASYDGVFAMWYGKGPGVDRSGDALKHGNAAGSARYGGVLLLAGDDHTCKSSTLAHQSEYAFIDAVDPGAEPVRDRGNSRFRPLRLGDVALFGLLDRAQDGGRDDGQFGLDRSRSGTGSRSDCPKLSRCPRAGSTSAGPIRRSNRNTGCTNTSSMRRRAFAGANRLDRIVIDSAKPRFGIVTTGKSYLDVRQALDDLGIDDADAAEIGFRLYKVGNVLAARRRGHPPFRRGARRDPGRRGKARRHREPAQGAALQLARRTCGRGSSASSTKRATGSCRRHGELTPAQIARVIAARIARFHPSPRIEERLAVLEAKERQLGRQCRPVRPHPLFLLGLSAQHLDQGARGQPRARRHRLPLPGAIHGPLDRDLHPDGRRGRAVDRPGAVYRDAARLRQSRRRHLYPFRRTGDPRRRRRQGQHHL